jgi:hypothetical protein
MRYISSLDYFMFYLWIVVSFIKTYIDSVVGVSFSLEEEEAFLLQYSQASLL